MTVDALSCASTMASRVNDSAPKGSPPLALLLLCVGDQLDEQQVVVDLALRA
jgi:hypothetical protein